MPPGGGAIRVLNVAEKPSVAKAVAEILSRGGMQSRAGRSRYNRVFEFNYAIGAQACHMLVTSVTGHLMELDFDDRYRKWYSCDPVDLFHAPVRKAVPQVPRPPLVPAFRQTACARGMHRARSVNGGVSVAS
jgi:DNA topoisomerase-3